MDDLDRAADEIRRYIEATHANCPAMRAFCLQLLEQEVERVRREDAERERISRVH